MAQKARAGALLDETKGGRLIAYVMYWLLRSGQIRPRAGRRSAIYLLCTRSVMMGGVEISELNADAVRAAAGQLGEVLADCVAGGASVSFMLPYSVSEATGYFRCVADDIEAGTNVLLAASLDGRIVGTVQLGLVQAPNQPHRGDVKKLLVRRYRAKQGHSRRADASAGRRGA